MRTTFRTALARLGVATAAAVVLLTTAHGVRAADIGGSCCADLEERIAELEATAIRKYERKVAVQISGQINKTVLYWDIDDANDWSVGDNSNAPSYLHIGATARLGFEWRGGFVLELGVGGYDRLDPVAGTIGYGHFDGGTNEIYVRKSNVWVENSKLGRVTVGKLSQATDGVTTQNTSQAWIVSTPLSLRPLTGPGAGEALDIFDGGRVDGVRYDTPLWGGLLISASIAPASASSGASGATDGSIWDVAISYYKVLGEFKAQAAVGYRNGVSIENDDLAGFLTIGSNVADIKVWSGSASLMHIPTGLFVTGAAGQVDFSDWGGPSEVRGWHLQGGIEEKWGPIGRTTLFVERGEWDLGSAASSSPGYWGAGIVQGVDAAAMELYLSGRKYDMDGLFGITDATVVTAGARVRF